MADKDKISVITVVYNDVEHIRETMESFFSQTWENKEYIVIDGGSTDGTVDVIREYADRLAYWCSEKDDGIYDAMNKGILHVTGDWINILNCGDFYCDKDSLKNVMTFTDLTDVDVVYGNSIEETEVIRKRVEALDDESIMDLCPVYRHGSSLIKTSVQKRFLYDLAKKNQLGYALDWDMIYRVYKAGFVFRKVNVNIEVYRKEGISNHPIRNLWYNYLVTSQNQFNLKKILFLLKAVLAYYFKNNIFYKWFRALILEFFVNDILPLVPFWNIRKLYLKFLRMHIGKGSFIMKRNYIMNANLVKIGNFSHINRGCLIDARGKVEIGDSVSISHNVNIMTGSHDINSSNFVGVFKPIKICDYAFIGVGATILQGVTIGKGAVVCAGSVVTNDVGCYDVVAGIPAKVISKRKCKPLYHCVWTTPLT